MVADDAERSPRAPQLDGLATPEPREDLTPHLSATVSHGSASTWQGISGYERLGFWETITTFKICTATCFFMASSAIVDGYQTGINASVNAFPPFLEEITADGTGFVNGEGVRPAIIVGWSIIFYVGAITGMLSVPFLSDRFGRKRAMYGFWGVLAISATCQCFAYTWYHWLVAQLISGVGIGSLQIVVPTYIAECAPVRARGGLLTCYGLWYGFGKLGAALAFHVLQLRPGQPWRLPIWLLVIPVGLVIIVYLIVPESPAWCATSKREQDGKQALRWLYRDVNNYDIDHQWQLLVTAIEHENELARENGTTKWFAIFKGTDGRRTLVALWTLLTQWFVGGTIFSGYAVKIFAEIHIGSPFEMKIVTSCIGLASIAIVVLVADRVGRRRISCSGTTICLFACLGLGIMSSFVEPKSNWKRGPAGQLTRCRGPQGRLMVMLACVWNIGMARSSATGWPFIGEISSQRLRSYTAGFGAAITYAAAMIMSLVVAFFLRDEGKLLMTGWLYFGTGIPCVIGMWYLIPETKGRSSAELDELFERRLKARHFRRAETATQLLLKAQDASARRERRPSAVESSLHVPIA